MKVHYTGKLEKLDEASTKKVDAKFAKLGKLLDRRSEKEAHVILTKERRERRAEITVNYYDHPLVGVSAAPDFLTALLAACDKIEKQVLKLQTKRRDTKRRAGEVSTPDAVAVLEKVPTAEPRVYRVNHADSRKPMTVEEAMIEIGGKRNYVVYRDAETGGLSVLVRRNDGHFDLVEA